MSPISLKAVLFAFAILQIAPPPPATPNHLRYQRTVLFAARRQAGSSQACAVLGAEVLDHSAASLKDLRLFRGQVEVPYAITLSESLQQESEDARILNLGLRRGRDGDRKIAFDLEMPRRPYTNVSLDLAAKDFIATASITGEAVPESAAATALGSFTLFDLTTQHLARSTSIPLTESSFPYLHVELAMTPAPGINANAAALRNPSIVKSASVPPSREAQTAYTVVAETATLTLEGRQSVATFQVPVRVPVERISFVVAQSFKGNFSRDVQVKAHAIARTRQSTPTEGDAEPEDETPPRDETLAGTISRVHATEAGRELDEDNLSLPAAVGSNMQRPATVEVAIDNGDDQPLPITAVKLEMRQRRICFDAAGGSPPMLYYGDASLEAPVYDYAKLFRPAALPLAASLGAETLNAHFLPRTDATPFTERHPELLWIGLLAVVGILAVTAIRSAKKLH